ncbi:DNA-directed RNA polymerase subunit beta [Striga asiatica]|uniref:DNA-directed RNA polymerase subunit beta n=1 Tax=Striga asiatica TaxID=4170 RepID=A0A5A7RBJ0_STRAF|nr:DNA-directed RNA polymerase subunit beta [Striga asiatica]
MTMARCGCDGTIRVDRHTLCVRECVSYVVDPEGENDVVLGCGRRRKILWQVASAGWGKSFDGSSGRLWPAVVAVAGDEYGPVVGDCERRLNSVVVCAWRERKWSGMVVAGILRRIGASLRRNKNMWSEYGRAEEEDEGSRTIFRRDISDIRFSAAADKMLGGKTAAAAPEAADGSYPVTPCVTVCL